MKKFVAFLIGFVMVFQVSVVFAAPMEPAVHSLLGFNRWLRGNDNFGSKYINNNFEQAYHQAKAWDADAMIGYIQITYQQPGPAHCVIEFGSVKKPREVFKVECIDPVKINIGRGFGVKITSTLVPANFFDVPVVKLSNLVKMTLASSTMMHKLRTQMNGTSQGKVEFTLTKGGNDVLWKWGVSDGKKLGLHISADAMSASPVLMFEPR